MVNGETEDVELDRGGLPEDAYCEQQMESQPSSDENDEFELQFENDVRAFPKITVRTRKRGNDVEGSEEKRDVVDAFKRLPDEMLFNWGDVTSSPIVISVSRLGCAEDDDLVRQFLSLFPTVGFNKDVTATTTHLIMMNTRERSCPKRSLRYIYAVVHKCMLLNKRWLEECIKSKSLVDSTKYALTAEPLPGAPGWVESRLFPKSPLFKHIRFFLPKSFCDSKLLPRERIIELITLCGGSWCGKPWEVQDAPHAYTIFMPRSREWDAAYRYQASMNNVPVVVADWLLDCIAMFTILPIDRYRVSRAK